jgi:hypothetical protein
LLAASPCAALASNTADISFGFYNILDGTGDPNLDSSDWNDLLPIDYPDEEPK